MSIGLSFQVKKQTIDKMVAMTAIFDFESEQY